MPGSMHRPGFLLAAGLTLLLLGAAGQARAADATAKSPPAATSQPRITYALQLGSFHERQSAIGEEPHFLQRYGDLMSKASMIIEEAPSGPHATILRLVAGSFTTRAAAEAACARLIAAKDACFVLKRIDGHAPEATDLGTGAKTAAPARVTAEASPPVKNPFSAAPAVKTVPVKTAPVARVIPVSFTAPPAIAVESAIAAPVKPVVVTEMPSPEAAPEAKAPSHPAPPARRVASNPSAAQLEPTNRSIGLELGKGTLIHVDQPASTVFIADPSIADVAVKSPRMIYLYGKKVGDTVLYVVGAGDRVMLKAQVTVRHDLADLRQSLRGLVPEGSVQVATAGSALVLSGSVPTAAMSANVQALAAHFVPNKDDIINRLKVTEPDQINLQVRVAEMSRSTLKNFGINLDSLLHVGNFVFGAASGNPAFAAGAFATRSTVSGANATNNNLGFGFNTSKSSANGLIDALSTEGLITVLAEPNLTALSGETASFLAGGEFPIPVPQGNNTTTIMFKQFGVSLSFTPTILSDHRIDLRVRPEVSELSTVGAVQINGFTIPALTERRADTTVELASGQSFAIAGLLQNNSQNNISKFPGLGDLPVLGALFRSTEFQRNETELVIIVTPYIVRPVDDATSLKLPTQGFTPTSEFERTILDRLFKASPNAARALQLGGAKLHGDPGFIFQ